MTTVLATTALCPPGAPEPGWIAIEDGVIVEIGRDRPPGGTATVHDLGDALVTPGFLDLQCNGVDGDDLAAGEPEGWRRVATTLARHGTTSYCATLISAPLDAYDAALATAMTVRTRSMHDGAALLGVHLEGPFLGDAPRAHDPAHVRAVELPWLEGLLVAHPALVRIVTLAPEADPGLHATHLLADAGVIVALGHSTATYDEACAAADAGAHVVTHLFNGMGPLHHREPGLVGAALDDDRLTPTLIADGVHVHPVALRLALRAKQAVAVVSDAISVGGAIEARDGVGRLADGTLAGATTLLDSSVAVLVRAGVAVERAVEVVSAAPADVLGLTDRGRLTVGSRADVVALDPTTFVPRAVWIAGDPIPMTVGP